MNLEVPDSFFMYNEHMENIVKCTKCGLELEQTSQNFYKRTKKGWETHCKKCRYASVQNNPNRQHAARKYDLKRQYGLSVKQYNQMLEYQNGVCASCGKPCDSGRLSVDHDHGTMIVRGLLCRPCNLRASGDNTLNTIEELEKLIAYLKDWPALHAIGQHSVTNATKLKKE